MRGANLVLAIFLLSSTAQAARPVFIRASAVAQNVIPIEQPARQSYKWRPRPTEEISGESTVKQIPQHADCEDKSRLEDAGAGKSPALIKPFPGAVFDGFNPPDPIVAAGPDQVVAVVNTTLSVYTKAGQRRLATGFRQWFSALNTRAAYFFDPKVLYDQYSGHFIFLCLGGGSGHSWVFFSVSRTKDATGEWALWALDMQLNNQTAARLFADFPGLGINPQGIYITANMFDGQDRFRYSKLRILKKSQVYSFGNVTWRDFVNLKDAANKIAINVQPVHSFGDTPVEYLVETDAVGGNALTLWTLMNPVTAPALQRRRVTVSDYHVPPPAAQKGGGVPINTGDAGVLNAVYRDGSIYTSHNIAHNWGSGTVSAIRYYQLSTTGIVLQEITYGRDGLNYFYPVVMPDSAGNVALVFNRCGVSEFAGIHFTGRRAGDASGTLQNSTRLKAGLANYDTPDPESGVNLWGDYNGIALDADDSLWIFSEYVQTPIHWATQVARIQF